MLDILMYNKVLFTAITAWLIAQLIKIAVDFNKQKKLDLGLIMSSGGMPSSHSSFVTSCATSIAFAEGLDSSMFALSFVLSMVVMYDATGVRREAGKQAQVLNNIVSTFENENFHMADKLKELLGHTPIQVFAGACLGILISTITYLYL